MNRRQARGYSRLSWNGFQAGSGQLRHGSACVFLWVINVLRLVTANKAVRMKNPIIPMASMIIPADAKLITLEAAPVALRIPIPLSSCDFSSRSAATADVNARLVQNPTKIRVAANVNCHDWAAAVRRRAPTAVDNIVTTSILNWTATWAVFPRPLSYLFSGLSKRD